MYSSSVGTPFELSSSVNHAELSVLPVDDLFQSVSVVAVVLEVGVEVVVLEVDVGVVVVVGEVLVVVVGVVEEDDELELVLDWEQTELLYAIVPKASIFVSSYP